MHKTYFCIFAGVALWSAGAFAHLCNNIYRTPDRVVVKPEKPVTTVDRSDEFRVFVQNNYPTYLHNIRLAAKVDGGGVAASVTPEAVTELKAGERTAFTVQVVVPEGTAKGQYPLAFSVSANEIGFRPVEEASLEALRQATRDDNPSPVVLAAESLARRKDPTGGQVLTNMARQGDRDLRSRAIRALGKCGDRAHIGFLKGLLADQDGFIRGNALLALGCLKDGAATFLGLAQDRDEFVRTCAVAGLCLAGNKSADVLNRLRGSLPSSNVYVRIACGWALAAHRDREGVAALDQAFKTDDCMQRVMAGDALVDVANRPTPEAGGAPGDEGVSPYRESAAPPPQAPPPVAQSGSGGAGANSSPVAPAVSPPAAAPPAVPANVGQRPRPAFHRLGYGLVPLAVLLLAAGLFWRRQRRQSVRPRPVPSGSRPPSQGGSPGRYRRG